MSLPLPTFEERQAQLLPPALPLPLPSVFPPPLTLLPPGPALTRGWLGPLSLRGQPVAERFGVAAVESTEQVKGSILLPATATAWRRGGGGDAGERCHGKTGRIEWRER